MSNWLILIRSTFFIILPFALSPEVSVAASANNSIEAGEACDGTDLAGNTCASFPGFRSGILRCSQDRTRFDFTGCTPGALLRSRDCSYLEVERQVNAAADGDTVEIGNGIACDWGLNMLTVANKNLVLRGSGINSTTIASRIATNKAMITVTGNKPIRVTGFTFLMLGTPSVLLYLNGGGSNWRVDHNLIRAASGTTWVRNEGMSYGLIDNNRTEGQVLIDLVGGGTPVWKNPLDLGSGNAVYVEDNIQDGNIDGRPTSLWMFMENNGASRFVYRFNVAKGHSIGTHEYRGSYRGPFSYEIYGNSFERRPTDEMGVPIALRAGTGVVYDNLYTTSSQSGSTIQIYDNNMCEWHIQGTPYPLCNGSRVDDGNRVEASGSTTVAGQINDSTKTWQANWWVGCTVRNTSDPGSFGYIDANTATSLTTTLRGGTRNSWLAGDSYTISCGYPCRDQIGRSTDFSATEVHPQALQPLYAWNNKVNGALGLPITPATSICPLTRFQFVEGRDFYNNTPRPGYVAYPRPHPLVFLDQHLLPASPGNFRAQ